MNLIETFSAVLQSDTRQQVPLPQQKHPDIRDRNIRVYDQVGKRPQVFISLIQEISSSWDEHDDFDQDQLPFFIEVRENLKLLTENFKLIFQMFPYMIKDKTYVGLDLRLQYIEFMEARFRFKNLHHCGKPWEEISGMICFCLILEGILDTYITPEKL